MHSRCSETWQHPDKENTIYFFLCGGGGFVAPLWPPAPPIPGWSLPRPPAFVLQRVDSSKRDIILYSSKVIGSIFPKRFSEGAQKLK